MYQDNEQITEAYSREVIKVGKIAQHLVPYLLNHILVPFTPEGEVWRDSCERETCI